MLLNKLKGQASEEAALKFLRQHGLRFIAKNVSCKMGEIDLVMLDSSTIQADILVFIEVRYRSRTDFGGAEASVTLTKQQRIGKTAQWFRQRHREYAILPCRFDVVAVSGPLKTCQIRWLPSAFNA